MDENLTVASQGISIETGKPAIVEDVRIQTLFRTIWSGMATVSPNQLAVLTVNSFHPGDAPPHLVDSVADYMSQVNTSHTQG